MNRQAVFFTAVFAVASAVSQAQEMPTPPLQQKSPQQKLEVKGVALGATESELMGRYPPRTLRCEPMSPPPEKLCQVRDTFAEANAFIGYGFMLGRVANIYVLIDRKDFRKVMEAVTEKYGPPPESKEVEYTTGFGTKLNGKVFTWKMPNGDSLTAREFGSRLNDSEFWFTVPDKPSDLKDDLQRRAKDL